VIFVESSSIRNMLSLKHMQPRQTAQNWVVSCLDRSTMWVHFVCNVFCHLIRWTI